MEKVEPKTGSYVQLFVYRVPKKDHDAFALAQGGLADIFRKHGVVQSEFFQLGTFRAFGGFLNVAQAISASPEDEVWLELERYEDAKSKDEVVASIGKDPAAGPLFRQVLSLTVQGAMPLQGDFTRVKVG